MVTTARASSTVNSYSGLPPPARICASRASVAGSSNTLISLRLVDQAEEDPLFTRGESGQLLTGCAEERRCRGDVLRARVHVAKQPLDRAGAQGYRSRRLVDEVCELVARPGDVGHSEPHQRLLPGRQRTPRSERLGDARPGLVNKRAGRAVRRFSLRILLVERLAFGERAGAADAPMHLLRELVEQTTTDAGGPS